jgi:hypothetical protein
MPKGNTLFAYFSKKPAQEKNPQTQNGTPQNVIKEYPGNKSSSNSEGSCSKPPKPKAKSNSKTTPSNKSASKKSNDKTNGS